MPSGGWGWGRSRGDGEETQNVAHSEGTRPSAPGHPRPLATLNPWSLTVGGEG